MRHALAFVVATGTLAGTPLTAAAPAVDATTRAGAERCGPEPGARRHDGFFARSAPGVAVLHASVRGSATRRGVRGIGQSAALLLGGTHASGLVVGGTLATARIDPVFIERRRTRRPDDDSVKVTSLSLGPFLAWYPNPSSGHSLFGGPGFAVQIETDEKGNPRRPAALGAVVAVGSGYEWFVGDEVSFGAFVQSTLGYLSRTVDARAEHTWFAMPSLSLMATYH